MPAEALRTLAAIFGSGLSEYGDVEDRRNALSRASQRQMEQDDLARQERLFQAQSLGFKPDAPEMPVPSLPYSMAGAASSMMSRGLNAAPRADVPGVGRMIAPTDFGKSAREIAEGDVGRNTSILAGAFGGRPGYTPQAAQAIARGLASPGELFASPNYLPSAGGTPRAPGGGAPPSPTVIGAARRILAQRYVRAGMGMRGQIDPNMAWESLQASSDWPEAQRLGVTLADVQAAAQEEVSTSGRVRPGFNVPAPAAAPAPTLAELLSKLQP